MAAVGLPPDGGLITRFGLAARAKVGVVNLSSSYGVTNWLELSLSLPLVITEAKGSQTFVEDPFGIAGQATAVPTAVPTSSTGGGVVTPPNTGDAGLAESGAGWTTYLGIGFIAIAALLGASGFAWSRSR